MTKPDPYSILPQMLLDPGTIRDIADALDGKWSPSAETDPVRRERLLAAARLRLYGDRDRCGWYLVTHREAKDAGETRGHVDWCVGFLPDIDDFDDAPRLGEIKALERIYLDSGLEAEPALALAHAVLYEPVQVLVTAEPEALRHQREHDLPGRLRVLPPVEAFSEFGITAGEAAWLPLPAGSPLVDAEPWWVP